MICPNHKDSTPSLHVYPDGYCWCYVCSYRCRIEDLKNGQIGVPKKKEPEDIKAKIAHIKTLPIRRMRGLQLLQDSIGSYIVWPDESYYKLRTNNDRTRYVGPRGHKPPLFVLKGHPDVVVVVEGEINALSLEQGTGLEQHTICSPGAASEFTRHAPEFLRYKQIILVLDNDAPGIAAGWQTKELLLKAGKRVKLMLVEEDFNDLLQRGGPELVRSEFERLMK